MPGEPASQLPRAIVEAKLALTASGQIAGRVTGASGAQHTFFGWLELMDALEALRSASREEPLPSASD